MRTERYDPSRGWVLPPSVAASGSPVAPPTQIPPRWSSSAGRWRSSHAFCISLCANLAGLLILALLTSERPAASVALVLQLGQSKDDIIALEDLIEVSVDLPDDQLPELRSEATNRPAEIVLIHAGSPPTTDDATEAMSEEATVRGILEALGGVRGGAGGAGTGGGEGTGPEGTAEYYDLKVPADSVVFVVDASSSMGGEKFRLACDELTYSINQLDASQRFAVFFFSDRDDVPHFPSHRELVEATRENVAEARQWIRTVAASGNTDARSALRRALSLEPDVVFFLTDGAVWMPEQSLRVIYRYRDRHTAIHTIGFEARGGEYFLRQIARETGGTYRYIGRRDLPDRPVEVTIEQPARRAPEIDLRLGVDR